MTTLRVMWFVALATFFGVFIFYSVALPQLFGARTDEAWQWLLPNILPPVGALFGINLAQSYAAKHDTQDSDAVAEGTGSYVSVSSAIAFSVLFVIVLAVSVFGVVFADAPIEFLHMTNLWLAPLLAIAMGLIVACVPMKAQPKAN